VADQTCEVDRAISALTAEIIKLSPVDDEAKAALSVTIENALSRLALAIAGQSTQKLEDCLEAMPVEAP
jgi:hypothetical protein